MLIQQTLSFLLWEIIESILNCKLTYSIVIGGEDGSDNLYVNYLTTIMVYTVYKEWHLYSLDDKKRPNKCNLTYFENEICFRLKLYDILNLPYCK